MNIIKISLTLFVIYASAYLNAGSDDHHHEHEHEHEHEHDELDFEEHSSHVHGQANAQVSFENDVLIINMTFSSSDIFGFEHAPKNEEQRNTIKKAVEDLKMTEKIFTFNDDSCNVDTISIESDLLKSDAGKDEQHHDHEDEHHDNHNHDKESEESTHSDVFANYSFKCNTEILKSIEYLVFDTFPSIKEIEIQYISNDHQALFNASSDKRIQELQ